MLGAQHIGHLAQHPVALGMAVQVVDGLEFVDIAYRHRVALAGGGHLLQRLGERTPVMQAGQRIGPGHLGQVGVLLPQLLLVPLPLDQVVPELDRQPAQLDQVGRLPRQRFQRPQLFRLESARSMVHHAETAQRQALPVQQRRTGVEPDPRLALDEGVGAETRILQRIFHNHGPVGLEDRVGTEGLVTGGFLHADADPRLQPLPLRVHQAHHRHRHAADRRRDADEIVEGLVLRGVEDLRAGQGGQALGFIGGITGRLHGGFQINAGFHMGARAGKTNAAAAIP